MNTDFLCTENVISYLLKISIENDKPKDYINCKKTLIKKEWITTSKSPLLRKSDENIGEMVKNNFF